MGGDPLAGCIAKVKRADAHFNSLRPLIEPFLASEPKPYALVSKVDVKSSRYIGRIHIRREPPIEWSMIVGDYVQNLRAALDYLVRVLVRANGQQPTGGNLFPLFDQAPPKKRSHGERMKWNRQVEGLHPAVIHFIELCQPYKGPDGPRAHVLDALRRLSNEDKHRTLLTGYAAISEGKGAFKLGRIEMRDVRPPLEGMKIHTGKPLKEGDLVLEAPVNVTGPNPQIKLNANFTLDIGFGRKPVPMKGLVQMGDLVTKILVRARGFLGE